MSESPPLGTVRKLLHTFEGGGGHRPCDGSVTEVGGGGSHPKCDVTQFFAHKFWFFAHKFCVCGAKSVRIGRFRVLCCHYMCCIVELHKL